MINGKVFNVIQTEDWEEVRLQRLEALLLRRGNRRIGRRASS